MSDPKDSPPSSPNEDQPISELSGLAVPPAPRDLADQVQRKIQARSDGRFFGHKPLPERLPMLAIAIVALVLALLVTLFLRSSETGALDGPGGTPPSESTESP